VHREVPDAAQLNALTVSGGVGVRGISAGFSREGAWGDRNERGEDEAE
jgi:hypothetical protein